MKSASFLNRLLCLLLSTLFLSACAYDPGFERDQRGSYRGSFYQVNKGDTLYFVSYITDRDVKDIIAYNRLQPPYTIHPGQKLKLWNTAYQAPQYGHSVADKTEVGTKNEQVVVASSTGHTTKVDEQDVNSSIDQTQSTEYVSARSEQNVNATSTQTSAETTVAKPAQVPVQPVSKATYDQKISKWLWPTKGKVSKGFSLSEQGNKGLDITGQLGQAVNSTANGTVVYAGDALRGYGNLIIIKHNEEYLSAYAHNQKLFVKEGDSVQAGQKIALMGNTGTDSVKLHFEIRYKGKPVNPKNYLP
ncbi:MAG: peptidoglycan DD-metalloendopeptidase family protein [Vibrio sp.]